MKKKTVKKTKKPNGIKANVIGRFAKLIEKPDGSTSKYYDVEVGKKYKVVGIDGSAFRVKTPDGIATISADRFEV